MEIPQKLSNRLLRLRKKLTHNGRGLAITERRIRHFRHRQEANPGTRTARRARRLKHKWQRRQTWLVKVHRYLQLLDDKALKQKHDWLKAHPDPVTPPGNLIPFDGHVGPRWIVEEASEARASGEWKGVAISLYRSPEYCRQLCRNICGRDSCSGTCAGTSSNHCCPPTFTGVPHEGAIDASLAGDLRAHAQSHGVPLYNDLPLDYPHSSASGH